MVDDSATIFSMVLPKFSANIPRALELGLVPAAGMNVVTLVGLQFASLPPKLVGALQHFSAGILLTTLAKELFPEMVKAQGLAENLASGIGFFSGVGVLILLGILLPEDDAHEPVEMNDEEAVADNVDQENTTPPKETSLRNRRQSLVSKAFAVSSSNVEDEAPDVSVVLQSLPVALLAAVAIDSALDGLLVGISTAVGDPKTGTLLAASLAVESSFLGLTLAAALQGAASVATSATGWLSLLAAALAPSSILIGAISGGGLAPFLSDDPVLLSGFLGFGTSTTLFMVAEELLLQAHEDGSEHTWWVDLQLYTGFFASIMIEKFFGM